MMKICQKLKDWVEESARLTKAASVHWCTGSEQEYQDLIRLMLADGSLLELNQTTHPGCYLHRSDPNDVARTEHLTFVCTEKQESAGPNNNWMHPSDGHQKADALFSGCMQGRTMYVVPYCMGPLDSPYARCGVEITDSPYVVANMKLMTRMGDAALEKITEDGVFVKGLHSTGDLKEEHRLIMHFPEELMINSIGSGYGGNALLGKKCHALRIASYQGLQEGWLAEHMLIVGIENPEGEVRYIAAAFPSQCGKTNLAMLIPPESHKGWKVWTVGDDIAWLHPGKDGRLWAINPEAGFFGVAPGTSRKTNPNALNMLSRDTIFTNVAMTADGQPWWEGKDDEVPAVDWQGRPYTPGQGPAAHPNSRFTVAAHQCPSWSREMENPEGVPISAIVFGGRRPSLIPLVYESKNWAHGVLMGASVASETTAAATGKVGILRHDPMAMKPFCGYNFADYWRHWLSFESVCSELPRVFHVNWFRQGADGRYLWPGFGENLRVLRWVLDRAEGRAEACRSAIGLLPAEGAISTDGLNMRKEDMQELCAIDKQGWRDEISKVRTYLETFGVSVPDRLREEQDQMIDDLG
ncbi:MAG: phosphoenolpyruvate carboxykinase (GTP) [Deltaproteobacteria bacterium]|nr:phosphoenolpyruvate carboxykinase (GTP) [Deltaproteobacteria bacterium]